MEGPADYVDLLIIGAGPAGLMTALWASEFKIRARIVDIKSDRVQRGQADGLHARTLEILDSFGLVHEFMTKGNQVNEICSWNTDSSKPAEIQRTERVRAQPLGISEFPQTTLNQGATEKILLEHLDRRGRIHVERNTSPCELTVDDDLRDTSGGYPVTVKLKRTSSGLSDHDVQYENVKAKYVVGSDGAHSWVRHQTDIVLDGEKTDRHFGVMDIVPLTDFPDIRQSCVIHSENGSVMTVPRGDRLVRLYVQLDTTQEGESPIHPEEVTPEKILEYAKPIFEPYGMDFKVGQRLAKKLDYKQRIFLAGDAVHTHTPTLGQGMNVSMQDAYNLGWKLCSVLSGTSRPEILATYTAERQPVAEHLISLDQEMADFYSNGPSRDSEEYQAFRDQFSGFLSGVTVEYDSSVLVADKEGDRQLARHLTLGRRLPLPKVVCQAQANIVRLSDILLSDGKWRIVVLPGNIDDAGQLDALQELAPSLEDILGTFNSSKGNQEPVIDVIAIHAGQRENTELLDLHPVYHRWDDKLGWDYWRVYADNAAEYEAVKPLYEQFGVDRVRGCLVLLRPDQHVSCIASMDEAGVLKDHLSRIFVPRPVLN